MQSLYHSCVALQFPRLGFDILSLNTFFRYRNYHIVLLNLSTIESDVLQELQEINWNFFKKIILYDFIENRKIYLDFNKSFY